jgi:hypothetical protein
MTLRKFLIIGIALLILFAVAVGLTSINHPIILKWVTGFAKHHGKALSARVYTNGQLNEGIKVFYTDEENNYLLSLPAPDTVAMLRFININLNEKSIGRPVRSSKNEYDFIGEHLFQSERGQHFVPIQDGAKDLSFDPQLSFTDSQIKFKMPPNRLKIDSIRIILP